MKFTPKKIKFSEIDRFLHTFNYVIVDDADDSFNTSNEIVQLYWRDEEFNLRDIYRLENAASYLIMCDISDWMKNMPDKTIYLYSYEPVLNDGVYKIQLIYKVE